MNRKQRRAEDPTILTKKELFSSGGWGMGMPNAKPATGQRPSVNPFLLPKSSGLNVTSKTYPFNYFVEWNLSTWRTACDQAIKMGYTQQYSTLVQWVFESSPFIQSLFNSIYTGIGIVKFELVNENGEKSELWTDEVCNSAWFKQLIKEVSVADMWGFTGINFDPINNKIYKYPIADIDPINRMLRESTYSFFEGQNFDTNDNLLFVQPSTSYEEFLGKMQVIARTFIQMNIMSSNWVAAGRKLAFPVMSVGYPQADGALNELGELYNPYKIQAKNILENIDPQQGYVYPYTIDGEGKMQKAINVDFNGTGASSAAHRIFLDFNKEQKDELRELILGGTLSSNSGDKGARSLGEVHERRLENIIKEKTEYILTVLNDKTDFFNKLPKYYKNFPKNLKFTVNTAKKYDLQEIETYSKILNENGKKFSTLFFINNGLNPEYIEDVVETKKTDIELETNGNFGVKKKLFLGVNI